MSTTELELEDLLLEVWSVADMDIERAAAVGRAFDQDPELRPRRVGGDPARIRVDGTLEELIRNHGLPIDWLTVRTNSRKDGFEGGRVYIRPGRGGFIGSPMADGSRRYSLFPHAVEAGFLRSWTDAEDGRLDRLAGLFSRLCEAMDACYGIATVLPRKRAMPPVDVGLGDVGWLNFFGPAFVERWPRLASTGTWATTLRKGGVVIRVTETPWNLDVAAKQPLVDIIGEGAFEHEWGPYREFGVRVPSFDDHMSYSPGTTEMPWVAWLAEQETRKVERQRERRYASARRRREKAQAGRADLPPVERLAEWSASFDADDWRSFGRRLLKRLGGELSGPIGSALLEEIATAPLQAEEALVAGTDLGPVEIRWFIDDLDTVDLYLFGPSELPGVVDATHRSWAEQ